MNVAFEQEAYKLCGRPRLAWFWIKAAYAVLSQRLTMLRLFYFHSTAVKGNKV